jgi:hypothetical protein
MYSDGDGDEETDPDTMTDVQHHTNAGHTVLPTHNAPPPPPPPHGMPIFHGHPPAPGPPLGFLGGNGPLHTPAPAFPGPPAPAGWTPNPSINTNLFNHHAAGATPGGSTTPSPPANLPTSPLVQGGGASAQLLSSPAPQGDAGEESD